MYNHYSHSGQFTPVEDNPPHSTGSRHTEKPHTPPPERSKGGITQLFSKLTGLLKAEHFDSGDILLILIILFLFQERDNLDLIITLGLMLILGLGDE